MRCTGTATMLSRLSAVAVRSFALDSLRTSYQVLTACDHSAKAWMALVFPQLLGPISTAG